MTVEKQFKTRGVNPATLSATERVDMIIGWWVMLNVLEGEVEDRVFNLACTTSCGPCYGCAGS